MTVRETDTLAAHLSVIWSHVPGPDTPWAHDIAAEEAGHLLVGLGHLGLD